MEKQDKQMQDNNIENKPLRKAYKTPKLTAYGDIRELTLNKSSLWPVLDNAGGHKHTR